MRKLPETNEEYDLDRLLDEQEMVHGKLANMLPDEERYWFYRYSKNAYDLMKLKLEMQEKGILNC